MEGGRDRDPVRVLVVGGGITGLAAAHELAASGRCRVTLIEAGDRLGGKIRTSPFAGLPAVDEGADAVLTRVPDAVDLARRVGLGERLTHPTGAPAAVWHHGLHAIPDGLVLGVPAAITPMARTRLLSWRGKARAALEPVLPASPTDHDELGTFVRARFGDEVHERLVDALVGSIYAADTDRFSLTAVPQLATLATTGRSLLLGGRRARAAAPVAAGPVFAAPIGGMGELVTALATEIDRLGATVRTGCAVTALEPDGQAWRAAVEPSATSGPFDHVVLTTPAAAAAELVAPVSAEAGALLAGVEHADVVLVTLAVPEWPERLRHRSGYLVPKPVQRLVTAASFGSEKWSHWRPDSGAAVLRVSLGRDGLPVDHLDDDAAVVAAVDEVGHHVGLDLQPSAVRVSRWPGAFPQYRPHHHERVARLEAALPAGLHVAGASHHGIGIPACVRSATAATRRILATVNGGERR